MWARTGFRRRKAHILDLLEGVGRSTFTALIKTVRMEAGAIAPSVMASRTFDLSFDPNEVGTDLVVECWISQGPRRDDPRFDPQIGDWLLVGDDEGEPLRARVTRRDDNRVWVQVDLASSGALT